MKLVIDIDEGDYTAILANADIVNKRKKHTLEEAVLNGTPLPKEHGRLIDADEFISTLEDASKRHKYKELLIGDCLTVDDVFKAVIESLQNKGLAEGDAPTIIESESEE